MASIRLCAMAIALAVAGLGNASAATSSPIDAKSLTGASTPLQIAQYGVRNYTAPVLVNKLHDPANYRAAPKLPVWQFAKIDPTGGVLSFERQTAPANGWHSFSRKGQVVVTGGSAATANRVYTVFNKEQLLAAINEAGNESKIIRIVGHIDFRWKNGNTVFEEYTSYSDQKFGGSLAIPSNTTLVGINDAQGRPARITGTSILVGAELPLAAGGDPETDFKAWVAAGKDSEDYPTWTRNVIIRNLQIDTPWDVNPEDSGNAYADGVTISRAQNIWIDHVSISDGDTPDSLASDTRHDGALDIVRGSDYVTVTNSYFEKHHKTTLVGNGDAGRAWSDAGRLHVTLSDIYWNSLGARLPLVRFGQAHLFNNYIQGDTSTKDEDVKFGSALDVRYQSNVLSENNYYNFTGLKPKEACGKVVDGKSAVGLRTSGQRFISTKGDDNKPMTAAITIDLQCGLPVPTGTNAWLPPYSYTLYSADDAKTAVIANAGAGKLK